MKAYSMRNNIPKVILKECIRNYDNNERWFLNGDTYKDRQKTNIQLWSERRISM